MGKTFNAGKKLVIEITDEGRKQIFERKDGTMKLLYNIDSYLKSGGKGRRIIKGVAMFFVEETAAAVPIPGAGAIPAIAEGPDLSDVSPLEVTDTQEVTHSG